MKYENISEDENLGIEISKKLLSDLLDPSVTFLKYSLEAHILVGIRRNLGVSLNLSEGIFDKINEKHLKYLGQNCVCTDQLYEEVLAGSLGRANAFACAALAQWGRSVPGSVYCWLVDIHARALRAHLKFMLQEPTSRMWVSALDKRSPFPAFGKGSRIRFDEYKILVAHYRRLRKLDCPPLQPIATPNGWNSYWREDETEHRNDNKTN